MEDKELELILNDLREVRHDYDSMYLKEVNKLSELLRKIMSKLFYLADIRVEYHEKWLDVYNETTGTNAAKEREADNQVRELYQIRHITRIAEKTGEAIRSQISLYKNENK
jgi:hypothetical protein